MKTTSSVETTVYNADGANIDDLLLKIKNSFNTLLEKIEVKDYTITRASLDSYNDDDNEAYISLSILYTHEVDEAYFVKKREKDRQARVDIGRREIQNILKYSPELQKEFISAAPEKI